jgi:hypothetical protein
VPEGFWSPRTMTERGPDSRSCGSGLGEHLAFGGPACLALRAQPTGVEVRPGEIVSGSPDVATASAARAARRAALDQMADALITKSPAGGGRLNRK